MRLAVAVVVVAACQRNAPDPCASAFHAVQPLMFGGATYAGPPALVFGMTCPELTAEDFACLGQATTKPALDKCEHATQTLAKKVGGPTTGTAPQAKDLARVADAVCACADLDCVIAVGQRESAFELPRRPFDDKDPAKATETRLKDCLKTAK